MANSNRTSGTKWIKTIEKYMKYINIHVNSIRLNTRILEIF